MPDTKPVSPSLEAFCEFKFTEETAWDWTIPGLLYDLIKDRFPEKSQAPSGGIDVSEEPNEPHPERVQMKSAENGMTVEVGPYVLSVKHNNSSVKWSQFQELIENVYQHHSSICGQCHVSGARLRYLNFFPIAKDVSEIGKVFRVTPSLPEKLDKPLVTFYQQYVILNPNPPGILLHETGDTDDEEQKRLVLGLTFLSYESGFQGEAMGKWLQAAHRCLREAFFESLMPDYLQLLDNLQWLE